jgi:hypothetical protein
VTVPRPALAVLLALSLLAACDGSSKKTAASKNPGGSTYLVPNFLPFGFKLTRATIEQPGPAVETFAVAVGRPAAAGAFDGVIRALVKVAAADRAIPPGEKDSPVDVGGARARLHVDADGASVDWFVNGLALAVTGPTSESAAVVDVAKRLLTPTPSKPSAASLGSTPAGYRVIASDHFVGHAPEAGYVLGITGSIGLAITVVVFATRAPVAFGPGMRDRVEATTVRGHDALISRDIKTEIGAADITQSAIDWYERPGALVSMIGNVPAEQMLPIAVGLARVTQAEWVRRVPLQQSGP